MISFITQHLLQFKNKSKKDISSKHPMSNISFMQTEIRLPQRKRKNIKKRKAYQESLFNQEIYFITSC